MSLRSNTVSHLSRFRGFILSVRITCRTVKAGYKQLMDSLVVSLDLVSEQRDRSVRVAPPVDECLSNNALKFGFKYIASVSHGSISVHLVSFVSGVETLLYHREPFVSDSEERATIVYRMVANIGLSVHGRVDVRTLVVIPQRFSLPSENAKKGRDLVGLNP